MLSYLVEGFEFEGEVVVGGCHIYYWVGWGGGYLTYPNRIPITIHLIESPQALYETGDDINPSKNLSLLMRYVVADDDWRDGG